MKKMIKILCVLVVLIVVLVVCVSLLGGDSKTVTDDNNVQVQRSETLVYEDDNVSVWYLGDAEEKASLEGMCYFSLMVENKTDEAITFYPMNSSVDGNMVTVSSGIPLDLKPKTKGVNSFFFNYTSVASNVSELSRIELSGMIMTESGDTVYTEDIAFEF